MCGTDLRRSPRMDQSVSSSISQNELASIYIQLSKSSGNVYWHKFLSSPMHFDKIVILKLEWLYWQGCQTTLFLKYHFDGMRVTWNLLCRSLKRKPKLDLLLSTNRMNPTKVHVVTEWIIILPTGQIQFVQICLIWILAMLKVRDMTPPIDQPWIRVVGTPQQDCYQRLPCPVTLSAR